MDARLATAPDVTDLFRWADGRPRVDVALLMPAFLGGLCAVLAACRARGADYYVTSGTRLWDEQAALRREYLVGKGGRAAAPGYSAHQFGLAVDVTFDADPKARGLQPSWREAEYRILIEEAERAGLHSGHGYGDRPHVSWPSYVSGADLAPLRKLWATTDGGDMARLRACWAHVEAAS